MFYSSFVIFEVFYTLVKYLNYNENFMKHNKINLKQSLYFALQRHFSNVCINLY
jgi:hypothetical protein